MSSRWPASLLALLAALGCDDGAADPPADAGLPADPCPEVALASGPWALHRCAAPGRFALRRGGQAVLDGATAGVLVAGAPALGDAWPEVVWAARGRGQDVLFVGHPTLPALRLHVELDPAPRFELAVTARDDAAPVALDALLPLVATAAGDHAGTLPTFAGPGPRWPAAPRPVAQALIGETSLLIHVFGVDDPLAEISVTDEAGAARVQVATTGQGTTLGPGDALRAPPVEVDVGPEVYALLEAAGVRLGPRGAPDGAWGWRTGGAYGALPSAAALVDEVAALRALTDARPAPLVLVDGLWFAALGAWDAGEGFPDGLAAAADALGDARLALRWPALWVGPDATACPGDCPGAPSRLDPGRPDVQDALGRAAVDLAARGTVALFLRDEAPDDEGARRGLGRALAPFAGPVYGSTADALGTLPGLSLVAPADAPGADCWAEAFSGPRSAACAEALRTPVAAAAVAVDPAATARALAGLRHLDGRVTWLDVGPIVLERPAPAARQAAALAAIAGGPRLLGDAPTRLDAAQIAPLLATLDASGLRGLQPTAPGIAAADAPAVWLGPAGAALFNFTDAPLEATLPDRPDLAGLPAVFGGPPFTPGGRLTLPAGDAAAWALPDTAENMQ
ncbi:MAG: hypothetical protein H6706_25960 [Myxococcales bacterium]|nr:hypothetical protein [Myxococcales bacterium]